MIRLSIAPLAKDDLDSIWDYVAADNPSAADRLMASFRAKLLLLTQQPLLGEARNDIQPNLRCFPAGNYVVYYQFVERHVKVLRVLHGARDVKRLL
jgi:toxin ParE1/3/4